MNSLNSMLNAGYPKELGELVSSCKDKDGLVKKLSEDPKQLSSFLQNMNVEKDEQLAASLLYKLSPQQLENAEIKKVETALRNRGMLSPKTQPDIALVLEGANTFPPIQGHKSILALESYFFKAMAGFNGDKKKRTSDAASRDFTLGV